MEETYKKSKGNAGLDGVKFQLNLLTVSLLNALHSLKNWKMSTENKEAGKYDDLVLELPNESIFLQAKFKHSKRINMDQLLSSNPKNSDFSIPKYFFSYLDIPSTSTEKTFIICTNTDIGSKDLRQFVTHHLVSPDDILHYEGGTCGFFTFNDNILDRLKASAKIYHDKNLQGKGFNKADITDENMKDFLKHLKFFSSYPSGDKLEDIIEELLFRLNTFNLFRGISYIRLYKKIEDWFKQPKGEYLTEERAKAMFSEIKSDRYCVQLKNYNVSFTSNELNFRDPKRVFVVHSERTYLLQALKIYDALQKEAGRKLYVNPDDEMDVKKQVIESFVFSRYCFLIIIGSKTTEEISVNETIEKLKDIIIEQNYKKVIWVTQQSDKVSKEFGLQSISYMDGLVTIKDLSENCQKRLITQRKISFQGDLISLEELLSTQASKDLPIAIDCDIMENLIRRNIIRVGAIPTKLSDEDSRYYIDRVFKRHSCNNEIDSELEEENEELFSEENICNANEKAVLIADIAGMGKSTVLAKLATSIKAKNPNLWIMTITLTNYTDVLKKLLASDSDTISMQLLNSKRPIKFENYLERYVFFMKQKVVLFVDGFDEISPDYSDIIFKFLTHCVDANNFIKLFVTTRPHLVQKLKKVLKVKPFVLQPFTEQKQVDFLNNYWRYKLKVNHDYNDKCKQYARALITKMSVWTEMYDCNQFTAIPLHLRMLAEIFQENIKKTSEWEGCKEFLEETRLVPKLPKRMEIKKIYDMFVQKKEDLYLQKENSSGNIAANKALMKVFSQSHTHHKILALKILFDREDRRLFTCHRRDSTNYEELLNIGIMQKSNNVVSFIHRNFVEYFVADCLFSELELQLSNPNLNFQQFLFDKIFQSPEYKTIRIFLDSFLQNIVPRLSPNIFDNYKSQAYSTMHRNQYCLIHLLAGEGCIEIVKLILKSTNIKIVRDKEINIADIHNRRFLNGRNICLYLKNKNDNVLQALQFFLRKGGLNIKNELGRTPLHNAVEAGHFEMMRFLIEHGSTISITDKDGHTVLHFASLIGHEDIVDYLIERKIDVNIKDKSGHTALHYAAIKGHLNVAQNLAKSGDVNIKDREGRTALHLAAASGLIDLITLLLNSGVNPEDRDYKGCTALHYAAAKGHLAIVEYLVRSTNNINIRDNDNRTALHLAASHDQLSTIKLLLKLGQGAIVRNNIGQTILHLAANDGHLNILKFLKEIDADFSVEDINGRTPLYFAVVQNNLSIIEYLLKFCGEVNVKGGSGCTPLHLAVAHGELSTVKFLIEMGQDVNARNARGRTVLHFAAAYGHLDIFELLLNMGVDYTLEDSNGLTALYFAVVRDKLSVIRYFLRYVNNVHIKDSSGRTALHFACERGKLHTVKVLLQLGVDFNVVEVNGRTELHLAAASGCLNVIAFLIGSGVDIDVTDFDGTTPLHFAARNGYLRVVKLLLDQGADVNIGDIDGSTALHFAAGNGRLGIVTLLLELGVNINLVNLDGNTALHFATGNGHMHIVKYLLEKGSDPRIENNHGKMARQLAPNIYD